MQRSVKDLVGYTISAKDGEIGKVDEFFFDDLTWTIRYLVVMTGPWLFERRVLIPHAALGRTDWETRTFEVNLTMEQVKNSPDIETEKTVSRQHEIELFTHYALPIYWEDGFFSGPIGMVPFDPTIDPTVVKSKDDPHLRSTKKVMGYHIHASDGEIGHVEDYIVDDKKWDIYFLIVDTHNWLPGKKVLISPRWIHRIDWDGALVHVNLSRESIKNSPEYNPCKMIGKDYVSELFNHYGEQKMDFTDHTRSDWE